MTRRMQGHIRSGMDVHTASSVTVKVVQVHPGSDLRTSWTSGPGDLELDPHLFVLLTAVYSITP